MAVLPSYVQGAWWSPRRRRRRHRRAGRLDRRGVAAVSTDGLDLARRARLRAHGRAGSLGALTFHQRALLLKQFALRADRAQGRAVRALGAHRRDPCATRWVDIDGGIGVLFTYSSKGRRELPNAQVYVDGPVEPLSKDGIVPRPAHLHPAARRRGADQRLQLPGVGHRSRSSRPRSSPACRRIVKPATPTGYLAEACVRILVESGLLPDGSLQLVSRQRARPVRPPAARRPRRRSPAARRRRERLRAHDACDRRRAVHERDRLDQRLGARPGRRSPARPEFDAYVKQLVTEMTSKAGQKCTAIRRAIVPAGSVDAVDRRRPRDASPSASSSATRAPRASRWGRSSRVEQRDEVLRAGARARRRRRRDRHRLDRRAGGARAPTASTARPPTARSSRRCCCASTTPRRRGRARGRGVRPGRVACSATTRRRGRATSSARGGGSLVTSVATHDPAVAVELVLGIAALQRARAAPRPRRRALLHRARLAGAAPRARRAGPRRRRRGARRHPRGAAPHAAHRGAGLARDAHRAHRRVASGRGRASAAASIRSASRSPSCASATRSPRRRAR